MVGLPLGPADGSPENCEAESCCTRFATARSRPAGYQGQHAISAEGRKRSKRRLFGNAVVTSRQEAAIPACRTKVKMPKPHEKAGSVRLGTVTFARVGPTHLRAVIVIHEVAENSRRRALKTSTPAICPTCVGDRDRRAQRLQPKLLRRACPRSPILDKHRTVSHVSRTETVVRPENPPFLAVEMTTPFGRPQPRKLLSVDGTGSALDHESCSSSALRMPAR